METEVTILEKIINLVDIDKLTKVIISNPINKNNSKPKKILINKINLKNKPYFQISYFIENMVIHENIKQNNSIIEKIIILMLENFKQCEILANNSFSILMNRKKQFKITGIKKSTLDFQSLNPHNREKNYILKDGEFSEWLYRLNITDKNGIVKSNMQKKFKQLNKFLEILSDIESYIPNNAKIIDIGCGKSYLTFAMYHYFNVIKNKNVKIKGYDLKKEVIENCNKLSKDLGFKTLEFLCENAENVKENEKTNMIISLHACNTATDYAIYLGIKLKCDIILSVPCCQQEINKQIKNDYLNPILNYGIFKERFSAMLTDTIRAELLKLCGYNTKILEFIDMEHTPKNILIKSIKKENFKKEIKEIEDFKKFIYSFNLNPTLYKLLEDYLNI